MVRVSIEVRSGTSRFRVAVSAGSVRRALGIAGGRHPGRMVGVRFPRDPAAEYPAVRGGRAGVERSKTAA